MKRAEWKAEHRQPTRAAALQATCGSSVCQSADGSMAVPQSSPSSEHLMPLMMAFPGGSVGKETACNAGDLGLIPGLGRSPEEEMATHSSILAWKSPWTEEPGGLQPMGSQRVEHNLETNSQITNAFKSIQLSSRSVAMTNKQTSHKAARWEGKAGPANQQSQGPRGPLALDPSWWQADILKRQMELETALLVDGNVLSATSCHRDGKLLTDSGWVSLFSSDY